MERAVLFLASEAEAATMKHEIDVEMLGPVVGAHGVGGWAGGCHADRAGDDDG
jgi:hypothetical protein